MIWVAYVTGGFLALVLVMVIVGYRLPREHVAARCTVIARPPDEVWRVLADVDAYPRWRHGVKRIARTGETGFVEHTSGGAIAYAVVEDRERWRRIAQIADDKLPFGGRWIYELAPEGPGTRLTITEDGFIKNPIFRFLARTVFSTTATLERFLADLGKHLGTPATIEPAPPSPLAKR